MAKAKAETFSSVYETLARKHHDHRKVFAAFCKMAACALSCRQREEEYEDEARHWDADDIKLFSMMLFLLTEEMEAKPFTDLLGLHYIEGRSPKALQATGEFYTPQALSQLCAAMTVDVESVPIARPMLVQEPAGGSGGMILAVAEHLVNLGLSPLNMQAHMIDVSQTACHMSYINTTLWGIPAVVYWGNTITLETWGAWRNIHFFAARGRCETDETLKFRLALQGLGIWPADEDAAENRAQNLTEEAPTLAAAPTPDLTVPQPSLFE